MLNIKKKDKVMVIAGDDKGKTGEVLEILSGQKRAIVSKINIAIKHKKPTQSDPGGRIEMERPVAISKLAVVCQKCSRPTKVKRDRLADGKKIRVCKNCGEVIL
ncbi:MAG: 50S ribosomal protein L24 [Elusimicrobia bacterium HGW-Elusimicrobia-1]|jgi:large subunit ribosomal protein L24|nr:MAG: 50S ribosomal protein L24 [Elusimicrobia bacterium HGW-Elusimicrobia-1]